MATKPMPAAYPIGLTISFPRQNLNRVSTAFRLVLAVPIWLVLILLMSSNDLSMAGFVALPTLLLLLFCHKYPRWWFDWNYQLASFATRVAAYVCLLDDRYPSTTDEQSVHLTLSYPNAKETLSRWLPLVKWFLALPHIVVLVFLSAMAVVAVVIAWMAILFTGRYPQGMFDFVVGVLRWHLRVAGYMLLMVTDQYPPFQLKD